MRQHSGLLGRLRAVLETTLATSSATVISDGGLIVPEKKA
jgi:hypothetical protein